MMIFNPLCEPQKSAQKLTKKRAGFTLIEVMLAMVVFAIAGVALLGSAQSNLSALGQLEQKTLASWVASNQLVEVSLAQKWPPRNNETGRVELAGQEWFWQQIVVKTTDKNMRALTIEVKADEKDESPLASFTTYVAKSKP